MLAPRAERSCENFWTPKQNVQSQRTFFFFLKGEDSGNIPAAPVNPIGLVAVASTPVSSGCLTAIAEVEGKHSDDVAGLDLSTADLNRAFTTRLQRQ